MKFFELIHDDLHFYAGVRQPGIRALVTTILFNPSFQLVFIYRLSKFFYLKNWVRLALICEWLEHILFGCLIAFQADIGRRFRIAHPIGIVIGISTIGDNVTIWQNVTIGALGRPGHPKSFPTIEDNVRVFAGSVIAGGITIGKNATIGALSFINRDVTPKSTVVSKHILHETSGCGRAG